MNNNFVAFILNYFYFVIIVGMVPIIRWFGITDFWQTIIIAFIVGGLIGALRVLLRKPFASLTKKITQVKQS